MKNRCKTCGLKGSECICKDEAEITLPINHIGEEIDDAIQMYEKQMNTHSVPQWLTTTDALCFLYLLKSLINKYEKK